MNSSQFNYNNPDNLDSFENQKIIFCQNDDNFYELCNIQQKERDESTILRIFTFDNDQNVIISNTEEDHNNAFYIKAPEKNEIPTKRHDNSKGHCKRGPQKNCLLGNKRKSNHKEDDALQSKSETKDIINEFKETTFSKDYEIKFLKSTGNVFENVTSLIFIIFVNMFICFFNENKKPEINVQKSTWKNILEKYIPVFYPDKENINLFKEYISNIYSNKEKDEENKKAYNLLENTPKKYFDEIIEKYLFEKDNKDLTKKYRIGNGMIKSILNSIKYLFIQKNKKEIKEDNKKNKKEMKEDKKIDNNNQKIIITEQNNIDDNSEEILTDHKKPHINKSNDNDNNIQIDINNKSTNCDTNEIDTEIVTSNNRKLDNDLFNILKNKLIKAFKIILEKMTKENINIDEFKNENNNNIEKDIKFMEENFTEIVKIKFEKDSEVDKLIKTSKEKFLENIMEDKYIRYYSKKEFFESFEEKKRNSLKNLDCKTKAIEIFEEKNLEGLIILTKLIKTEKTKKDFYIRIKDHKIFEEAMKKLEDDNFSLDSKIENKIQNRMNRLKKIAENPIGFLKKEIKII